MRVWCSGNCSIFCLSQSYNEPCKTQAPVGSPCSGIKIVHAWLGVLQLFKGSKLPHFAQKSSHPGGGMETFALSVGSRIKHFALRWFALRMRSKKLGTYLIPHALMQKVGEGCKRSTCHNCFMICCFRLLCDVRICPLCT